MTLSGQHVLYGWHFHTVDKHSNAELSKPSICTGWHFNWINNSICGSKRHHKNPMFHWWWLPWFIPFVLQLESLNWHHFHKHSWISFEGRDVTSWASTLSWAVTNVNFCFMRRLYCRASSQSVWGFLLITCHKVFPGTWVSDQCQPSVSQWQSIALHGSG